MNRPTRPDHWQALRQFTAARIALGRVGTSLPTEEILRFGLAHAQARDAVHLPFDAETLAAELAATSFDTLTVRSAAQDRATYLRRPDLGRRLDDASARLLDAYPAHGVDIVFVVGDGLSSKAMHRNALPVLLESRARLETDGFTLGPVVIAHQARVALGDDIGERLAARCVVLLIGERPGLSSPDSLGIYLTWAPQVGRSDAERNCISNIRPEGLSYSEAAHKLVWLLGAARSRGLTGVALKDESGAEPLPVGGAEFSQNTQCNALPNTLG